jgi:hypothetical protein
MATVPYSLEQAETDIASLRGLVDRMSEVLTQSDSTDPPVAPAGGIQGYSFAGEQKYADSAGQAWNTGHCTRQITANQTISSATDVVIGANSVPMTWQVRAGPVYMLIGLVNWAQNASLSQSQNNGYTGPATSGVRISNSWTLSTGFNQGTTGNQGANYREANSLADQASPAYAASSTVEWFFHGSITFSAAGTFSIVAAEGTSASYVIGANSYATLFVTT